MIFFLGDRQLNMAKTTSASGLREHRANTISIDASQQIMHQKKRHPSGGIFSRFLIFYPICMEYAWISMLNISWQLIIADSSTKECMEILTN